MFERVIQVVKLKVLVNFMSQGHECSGSAPPQLFAI